MNKAGRRIEKCHKRLFKGTEMNVIKAEVIDGNHLKLFKPIKMPKGSKLMLIYTELDAVSDEDEFSYQISDQRLEAGFGEDEPDYSVDMIKIHNPDYKL